MERGLVRQSCLLQGLPALQGLVTISPTVIGAVASTTRP